MHCELCERPVGRVTVHHLVPKQHDGHDGPKVELCSGCHRQVHALFSNRVLAEELDSLEKLRSHPQVARYVRWARKQDPGKRIQVRRGRR
jgi:hypothetical protein